MTVTSLNRCTIASSKVHLRLAKHGPDDKGDGIPLRGTLVIATAGLNLSRDTDMPAAVLKANTAKFEDAKMFRDHGDEFVFGRSFNDEVGFIDNVRFDDDTNQLQANFSVFDEDMAQNIRNRDAAGKADSARISLSILGTMNIKEVTGGDGGSDFIRVLESIEVVESVDFVTFDAANGHLIKIEQSMQKSGIPIKISASSRGTITKEDPPMENKEFNELQGRVGNLESELKQSLDVNKELVKTNAGLSQNLVRMSGANLISESELPEPCKASISDLLEVEDTTVEVIQQAIKAKKGELDELQKLGLLRQDAKIETVPGTYYKDAGDDPENKKEGGPSASESLKQSLVCSFKRKGIPADEAVTMAEKAVG